MWVEDLFFIIYQKLNKILKSIMLQKSDRFSVDLHYIYEI